MVSQQKKESYFGLEKKYEFIKTNPELFVITGAGVSHGSGIPTYRDDIGNWKGNSPIQHADFVKKESSR